MFNKTLWTSDPVGTNHSKHLWLSYPHHLLEELTFRIALQVGKISNVAYLHKADSVHTSFVWREWFPLGYWQTCLCCPETLGMVKHPAVQPVVHLPLSQLAGWPPTSLSLSLYLSIPLLHQHHPPSCPLFYCFRFHIPHFSTPSTSR